MSHQGGEKGTQVDVTLIAATPIGAARACKDGPIDRHGARKKGHASREAREGGGEETAGPSQEGQGARQEEEPAEDAPLTIKLTWRIRAIRARRRRDADGRRPVEAKGPTTTPPREGGSSRAGRRAGDKTKEGGDEPQEARQQKDKEQEKEQTVRSCLRIVVPSDKAGYVIGPRGKIVAHA